MFIKSKKVLLPLLLSAVLIILIISGINLGLFKDKPNKDNNVINSNNGSVNSSNKDNTTNTNNNSNNTTSTNNNSSSSSNNNNINFSDEELVTLLSNGNDSLRKLQGLYDTSKTVSVKDNDTFPVYAKLKDKTFTDYDSLYKYLSEKLSLDKYFSEEFSEKLVKHLSKEIDKEFYIGLGDFGIGINVKDSKISSKKIDGNKISVTFEAPSFISNEETSSHNVILLFENGKLIIDKMDTWGIPILQQ